MALSFSAITARLLNSAIKIQLSALCYANGLPVTSWIPGDPTERWLDITPRLMAAVISDPLTQLVRGMFLDLATDPGDVAADGTPDLSADQTPRPGFLSALGLSWFGTKRREQTYAALTVTVRNDGTSPATFSPFDLSFTTTDAAQSDGGRPTYRNTADAGVYTGIGGTITLAPGASTPVPLPLLCEQIGKYGSASANSMVCTVQSFGTLTVTASTQAVGTERESAPLYRARCRTTADAHSPGGPLQAYLRAMNTARDGAPLQRFNASGPVNITAAYVSPSSATGVVSMYVTGVAGPSSVDQTDVDSANANILGLPLGIITDPIGVLPDTVGFGPDTYGGGASFPSGTPSLRIAIADSTNITYSARIKASPANGLAPGTYSTPGTGAVKAVFDAIAAQLGAEVLSAGVNGEDFNGTSGVLYKDNLIAAVRAGFAGISNPVVTAPASNVTVTLGHQAVAGTITGTLVVT